MAMLHSQTLNCHLDFLDPSLHMPLYLLYVISQAEFSIGICTKDSYMPCVMYQVRLSNHLLSAAEEKALFLEKTAGENEQDDIYLCLKREEESSQPLIKNIPYNYFLF